MSFDRNTCIFCQICDSKGGEKSKILKESEEFVVFADIKPAAKHHYLIVTKEHIPNAKHLTKEQKHLVNELVELGKEILQEKGADLNDTRFGFHWPPFHSVDHLHLHAISPASQISFIPRIIFRENSMWFVSPEYVINRQ